jgi:hypothetical protein
VINCPNTGYPGNLKNAKKVIKHIRSKRKKKQQYFTKRKNLATTNYSDFGNAGKECIQQQVLNSVFIASETASVASSITVITGAMPAPSPAKSDQKCHVFCMTSRHSAVTFTPSGNNSVHYATHSAATQHRHQQQQLSKHPLCGGQC